MPIVVAELGSAVSESAGQHRARVGCSLAPVGHRITQDLYIQSLNELITLAYATDSTYGLH